MDEIALAIAIHVLAVIVWIGGVAMVTTVVFPLIRQRAPGERLALFHAVERRFAWQARIATLLVAASGFYVVARLDLWSRFRSLDFWWMHAMVGLWLLFTLILFVAEPLILHRWVDRVTPATSDAVFARLHWLHWVLLILGLITVFAAVAGSHGMWLG